MRLEKFRPRDDVKILLDHNAPSFCKTWSRARLMTWMAIDQQRGKRKPKGNSDAETNQPRFRKRNARMAGHFTLSSLLARADESPKGLAILSLFLKSGGFRLFLEGPRSAKGWLSGLKSAHKD